MLKINLKRHFKVGDIIREVDPYFLEPIMKVVGYDNDKYYLEHGPGRYGTWVDKGCTEIMFISEQKNYRKAKRCEKLYLSIIGWIIECLALPIDCEKEGSYGKSEKKTS